MVGNKEFKEIKEMTQKFQELKEKHPKAYKEIKEIMLTKSAEKKLINSFFKLAKELEK